MCHFNFQHSSFANVNDAAHIYLQTLHSLDANLILLKRNQAKLLHPRPRLDFRRSLVSGLVPPREERLDAWAASRVCDVI